jgi:tight adherence protein B
MIELLIYIILGVAVLLGAESLYHVVRDAGERERARLRRRLSSLGEPGTKTFLRERRVARSPVLDRLLRQFSATEQMEKLLLQTDLNWTVATMLGIGLILSVGCGALLIIVFPAMKMLALVAIPLGFILPFLHVLSERKKRSVKISVQIPDALEMMARSLHAGHGISAGFKLVATEMPPPIAVEFGRCFEENNLGVEFKDAVTNMTYRVPANLDLKLFAVSVMIQHETGGNLVEILEQISKTIRERFKFYGKLRALTMEGKASALIIGLLPFVFAVIISMLNPNYLTPMFEKPLGQMILLGGVCLWLFGVFWLRSFSQLDY